MNKIIAHLDMDCFFCQCEEKKDPELKGKPVIVGSTGNRGVVSAANYEARKFGVYSATPISKARMFCPSGVFLPVDKISYSEESSIIIKALKVIVDEIEQISIDEAYLDITSLADCDMSRQRLENIGKYLQKVVMDASEMTCSVGISTSRIVSKIASDFRKPGGVTVVENQKDFLEKLDIGKIPGIGKVAKKRFISLGINTIGDLARMDKFRLMDEFGMQGINLQNISRGLDRTGLSKREKTKSFSREDTFSEDVSDVGYLNDKLNHLSEKVIDDLSSFYFRTVSIKLRYSDFHTITRDYSFKTPQDSLETVKKTVHDLFENNYNKSYSIRLVGVKLSNITGGKEKQLTLGFFMDG